MADPLDRLDFSKGGIPATSRVKNRDKTILMDGSPWTPELIDQILTALAALRLGYIRTLTIVRKDAGQ